MSIKIISPYKDEGHQRTQAEMAHLLRHLAYRPHDLVALAQRMEIKSMLESLFKEARAYKIQWIQLDEQDHDINLLVGFDPEGEEMFSVDSIDHGLEACRNDYPEVIFPSPEEVNEIKDQFTAFVL